MSLENERQLENTRAKLRLLQDACAKLKQQPSVNAYVDELTRDSLQSQIKQLQEEIARYEIRTATRVPVQ